MKEIDNVNISLDQFEALRLCDGERLDQEETGRKMGISRGTVQRLLYSARKQIVDAIIQNNAIIINLKESEDKNAGMYSNKRKRWPGRFGR